MGRVGVLGCEQHPSDKGEWSKTGLR